MLQPSLRDSVLPMADPHPQWPSLVYPVQGVCLVGFGAIGQAIVKAWRGPMTQHLPITAILVHHNNLDKVKQQLMEWGLHHIRVADQLDDELIQQTRLMLECAGHEALTGHIHLAIERGIDCAILSVGALSDDGLRQDLIDIAEAKGAHFTLLAGAMAGIDALASARHMGLERVVYTGRKPPPSWCGTPAEEHLDLHHLTEAKVFFEGSARQAAQLFPKNANVAATLALAGLGLDRTLVRLVADPHVTQNMHEYEAEGAFGVMRVSLSNYPLPDNPKTSALTVMSALRFLHNQAGGMAI